MTRCFIWYPFIFEAQLLACFCIFRQIDLNCTAIQGSDLNAFPQSGFPWRYINSHIHICAIGMQTGTTAVMHFNIQVTIGAAIDARLALTAEADLLAIL